MPRTTLFASVSNFNSIKVRLELYGAQKGAGSILAFQFHKGAIRTVQPRRSMMLRSHFNSIKVRLEQSIVVRQKSERPISIP